MGFVAIHYAVAHDPPTNQIIIDVVFAGMSIVWIIIFACFGAAFGALVVVLVASSSTASGTSEAGCGHKIGCEHKK
jgi:hypothetical protein